jgi:hypothetical protein
MINPFQAGFGVYPADDGSLVLSSNGETLVFTDVWQLMQWLEAARDQIITQAVREAMPQPGDTVH